LEGRGFDDFVTEHKKLVSTYSFKEDNMVRDLIIFGIKNSKLKDRLINVDNFSLDKVEELCRMSEATKKELREMVSTTEAADIQAIKKKYGKQVQKPGQQENNY